MIIAAFISRIMISFTVRSIILWQSTYFSVSGVWEAEVVLSVSLRGEIPPFVPLPQPYKIPLQFIASPPPGDSTCPAHCSAFLKEIPNFISNLRLVSSDMSISQLCPGALVSYIWFHIVSWFLYVFSECSVLGVTLKWYVQSICLLKDLSLAL